MNSTNVFIETSRRKTFAGAIEWLGWCRSGKDEPTALQALYDYGARFAKVMAVSNIEFSPPSDVSDLVVCERVEGNSTTAFGAPAIILDSDHLPCDQNDLEGFRRFLQAAWGAFDKAVEQCRGKELRKGPRGGGRDLERILQHILDGDRNYLSRVAWKQSKFEGKDLIDQIMQKRGEILVALDYAVNEGLPEKGPRGGVIWPARFFVRRVVWHTIDHAWEIEDRIE